MPERLERDVRRRFRLALVGYVVLALAVFGSLVALDRQQDEIKHNQERFRKTTSALIQRDCELVVSTANVFVAFITEEINLRKERSEKKHVPPSTRNFDRAQVKIWTKRTLPELAQVYLVNCASLKVK